MYTYMQNFPAFNSPFTPGFVSIFVPLMLVIALWTLVLKGYSLWYAARGGQKWWFVALIIVNTFGVLEIVYLIWYRPKNSGDTAPEIPVNVSSPQ